MYVLGASPKAISGRTSYYQARLAFHFLPQLIPEYCTAHGFGPPLVFRRDSSWPWQARLASGLEHITERAINTWFPYASAPEGFRLVICSNSLVRSAKSTPSPTKWAPTLCKRDGFRFYFNGITSLLFTFPSRYWFTIGEVKYLALAG